VNTAGIDQVRSITSSTLSGSHSCHYHGGNGGGGGSSIDGTRENFDGTRENFDGTDTSGVTRTVERLDSRVEEDRVWGRIALDTAGARGTDVYSELGSECSVTSCLSSSRRAAYILPDALP
jgi:hypothetical protein